MIVTIFKSFSDKTGAHHRPIEVILQRIKSGSSRAKVEQIRSAQPEVAKQLKNTLPAILFSGTFRQRNAAAIIEHSGLICLDFDGFPDMATLQANRDTFVEDAYTYAVFTSPSGNGLKVLVKIPAEPQNHKAYFDSLRNKYNSKYFDIHCSDVCRICFESYDPAIHINYDSLVWTELTPVDLLQDRTEVVTIPIRSENTIVQNLIKWWSGKYSMTQGTRNANLYKLAIAMNDYGVNRNEAERVCSAYSSFNFGDKEIKSIVKSAYQHTDSFNTKQFEDSYTRKKIESLVTAGKDLRSIRKEFPELNETEIESAIDNVKDAMSVTDFWEYSDKGAIRVLHHKFKYFLQERNFFKFYPSGSNGFIFIKINENLLEETNKDVIKDYVLKYLEHDAKGIKPFDYMAEKTKYFTYDYLSFLDTKDIELLEDTPTSAYLYYSNCIVSVSKDKVSKIDYLDSDGYIWRNQIIDREYTKSSSEGSVFGKLLFYIANQEQSRFNSLRSVIGYLLHSFKTSANNKAIILNDETISDTPNGGSGKGLFWNALSHMKKVNSLDGKTFSFGDQFKYQTVSTDCQVLVFDDVKSNFDFESLFSLITEGIILERKGQLAIKLPVKKSPKILITTNYTVGGVGGSFDRRKFEVEFSSYFNANNTPLAVFKHLLFDEWNREEWSRFDNFMIECLQFYFEHGLVQHEFKNLEVRKFISKTSTEFYEFTQDPDNIPHNTRIYSAKFYEAITSEYMDLKKWLTQKRLRNWVNQYAIYHGLKIQTSKDVMGRYFELLKDGEQPATSTNDEYEYLTKTEPLSF